MAKRKAVDASDEESDAEFSDGGSEPPLKQKKAAKPAHKRKAKAVSDDDEEEKPIKKRTQPKAKRSTRKDASEEEPDNDEGTGVVVRSTNEGDKYVDLGRKRRATVRAFKGKPLLDIREYYGQEGDENPGKKGIALNQEEWEKLKASAPTIDALFKKIRK